MLPWYRQKTFWAAVSGIFTTAGAYFSGDISLTILISAIFIGLGTIFMRLGIEKPASSVPWYKQKTTLNAIAGILTAIGGYIAKDINLVSLMAAVMGGLGFIFMRQGIEKSNPSKVIKKKQKVPLTNLPPSERGEVLE